MGPDLDELGRLSQIVQERIADIPGLVDLDSSLKPNKPMVNIEVHRDAAADLGLSIGNMAGALRTWVAGQTVGNWRASDDQTYDVNVRLEPEAAPRRRTWSACRLHWRPEMAACASCA
jgi:HAE1 family hydrophobic/amphiphilic exporter-1